MRFERTSSIVFWDFLKYGLSNCRCFELLLFVVIVVVVVVVIVAKVLRLIDDGLVCLWVDSLLH